MRKPITLAIFIFICSKLNAQNTGAPIFLNHVYFVLDSDNYRHVFDSVFLKQVGTETEEKETTATSTWSGKYFYGLNSYFEIFPPNGYAGAVPGNFGLGFMTFKQGDIEKIKRNWQQCSKDSMSVDTTTWVSGNGKKTPWFYSVSLYQPDTLAPVNTWIMENTAEDLKAMGFTDEEIKKTISESAYMEKVFGEKLIRAFDRITAIDIVTNNKGYEYLEHSFLNFGLQRKHHNFFNKYITIHCKKAQIQLPQLKKITIGLDKPFDKRTLALTNHFIMHIKGKTAEFTFN